MSESGFTYNATMTAQFQALESEGRHHKEDYSSLKAVVIGGGTGAPVSIRTLLSMGIQTSAVVAMADDGGSTGILREEAHVTPPGDIRKCLAAFASNPDDPLTKAFKYRFEFARNHTLGNLMLSALEEATGSFPEAVRICGQLLDARGYVYPSTLNNVTLCAKTQDGQILRGQAKACKSQTALEQVWLESPERCLPYVDALKAIRKADLIVLGPGSLFTSIIPNLLVPGIAEAIVESKGAKVFVCSLADQQGETWGLSAGEHADALFRHGIDGALDYMLVHSPTTGTVRRSRRPAHMRADDSYLMDATGSVDESHPLSLHGSLENNVPTIDGHDTMHDYDSIGGVVRSATHYSDSRIRKEGLNLPGIVRPVRLYDDEVIALQRAGTDVIMADLVDPLRPTWHDPKALAKAFERVIHLCRSRQK